MTDRFVLREGVARLLRKQLALRLADVENRLGGIHTPIAGVEAGAEVSTGEGLDRETALRRCMVKYLPRLATRGLDDSHMKAYVALLQSLAPYCASSDLRFIDALNTAYEHLHAGGYLTNPDIAQAFLPYYRSALRDCAAHLNRRMPSGDC